MNGTHKSIVKPCAAVAINRAFVISPQTSAPIHVPTLRGTFMRKFTGAFAASAVVLALLAGCSSTGTTSPSTIPTPSTQVGGARGGPAVTGLQDPFNPLPEATQTPQLENAAPPVSGSDVSTSTYTVQQYVDYIVRSTDTYWTSWFIQGYGLQEPYVSYDVIEPTEQPYQTTCKMPGGSIAAPTPHDFPNAYYCGVDFGAGAPDAGMIILPATTFQKMWNGDIFGKQSQTAGDFAAAYLIAHEFGHHIVDEFRLQLAANGTTMPNLTGKNKELIADCFAGAWISHAYANGVLTDTDYEEAIRAAEAIGDQPGTISDDPHGEPNERMYAVRVGAELGANGYVAGHPNACTSQYWQ